MCICFNIVEMAANMYSELREEARDHARLRNAYFEQVRPVIWWNALLVNILLILPPLCPFMGRKT